MNSPYSLPREINDINSCYFYHSIDLPELGTIKGDWDLRNNIKSYLGNVNFSGKKVLDVGCANGGLSFYMEQEGAEVISYDLDDNGDWDMVPFAKWKDYSKVSHDRKSIINKLNNAYCFSHNLLKSKAKVVYGSVYAIPDTIGSVDISVYGSILLHLRDPFLALQNGLRLTEDIVIIAENLREQSMDLKGPYLGLLPNSKSFYHKDTWWDIRPEWVVQAIGVLGFEDVEINYHSQKYNGNDESLYTVVGRRTHGREKSYYVLDEIIGGYNIETNGSDKCVWVNERIEYRFNHVGKPLNAKVRFQFLLAGKPRILTVQIKTYSRDIVSYQIPITGGWGEYESQETIIDISGDIVICFKADGEPVRLSEEDPRKAKFLIKNLSIEQVIE